MKTPCLQPAQVDTATALDLARGAHLLPEQHLTAENPLQHSATNKTESVPQRSSCPSRRLGHGARGRISGFPVPLGFGCSVKWQLEN